MARSPPKASKTAAIFALSVIRRLRRPTASSGGRTSKEKPNAFRNSFGRRAAKFVLEVEIRIMTGEKVWQ